MNTMVEAILLNDFPFTGINDLSTLIKKYAIILDAMQKQQLNSLFEHASAIISNELEGDKHNLTTAIKYICEKAYPMPHDQIVKLIEKHVTPKEESIQNEPVEVLATLIENIIEVVAGIGSKKENEEMFSVHQYGKL